MPSFLSPWFLLGTLTAAIPVVLHVMGRRVEATVKFSAVRLLKQTPTESAGRQHLRHPLLLLLRVTALMLLTLAFARPFFAAAADAGRATIVVVDTSYSMSAPGRFELAKTRAREAAARAPGGELVGVVAFDDVATIVVRPTSDRALARSAIDGLTVGEGGTRYRAGLDAAVEALAGHAGTIAVVTDLQAAGWDAGVEATVPTRIELVDIGALPPNLSVTAIRAEEGRIVATVRNTGAARRGAVVHLSLDERPAGDTTTSIGPNADVDVAFDISGHPETAAVSLDDPEGLQADNVRYAVLGAGTRPAVVVVTATGELGRDAFYLEQALRAAVPGTEAFNVAGVAAAALSTWSPSRLRGEAAVMLLSTRGLERRAREALATYVHGGGGLLIAAGPDLDGAVVADVLGDARPLRITTGGRGPSDGRALAPVDVRHPVFRSFAARVAALGLVAFHQVSAIDGAGCQPIARFASGEAALIDCSSGDGHALVFASDLNNRWNDFARHPTFLPFLREAVRYLEGDRPRPVEYVVGEAPRGVPARAGFSMRADPPAGPAQRVAVNVDPREGDPTRLLPSDFLAAVKRTADPGLSRALAREQEDRQHLWQYAMVLMIGILAAEGIVASRTP